MRCHIALILAMLPVIHCCAQSQSADIGMVWGTAEVDMRISEKWLLIMEGSIRRADWVGQPRDVMARPSVEFRPTDTWRLGVGYARFSNTPYGQFPSDNATNEDRIWQEAMYRRGEGSWRQSHRLRIEQRLIDHVPDEPVIRRSRHMEHRFRFRPMLEYRAVGDEETRQATGFFFELLMQAGVQERIHPLDEWRVGAQYTWRPWEELQLLAGYMLQWNLAGGPGRVERGHVFLLQATLDLDLRKKEER